MLEDMPDRMPERMSERMSEDMPERMSEDMSDRMSEDMLDMRDRWGGREKMCQIECRKECQKDVSVDVSDKMYVTYLNHCLCQPHDDWGYARTFGVEVLLSGRPCCEWLEQWDATATATATYLDISFQSCGVCSYICHGGDHSKWSNSMVFKRYLD